MTRTTKPSLYQPPNPNHSRYARTQFSFLCWQNNNLCQFLFTQIIFCMGIFMICFRKQKKYKFFNTNTLSYFRGVHRVLLAVLRFL